MHKSIVGSLPHTSENGRSLPAIPAVRRSCRRACGLKAGGLIGLNGGQDGSSRSLNPREGLRQRGAVASIEVDVVAGRIGDVESDRLSYDESDRFGFEFPRITRCRSVVAAVQ